MDKESRRAELATRIKASFHSTDTGKAIRLFTRIMQDVYYWQREDGPIVTLDSISDNIQQANELNI